jgi:hypothetical protein
LIESSPGDVLGQPPRKRRFGAAVALVGCAILWLVALSDAGRAGDPLAIVSCAAGLLTCLAGLAVAIGRARVHRRGTWRAALVAACASLFGLLSAALLLLSSVRRSLREVPLQLRGRDEADSPVDARRPRLVLELVGVLIVHGVGALTWFAFLGFSSDVGTDRQLHEAIRFGAATWSVAALLIAWLWWSRRSPWFWWVPFGWWFPSFLLMIAVVYGWNSPVGVTE